MNDINFEVKSIKKANKENCVVVTIKFNGNEKEYSYVRTARKNKDGFSTIINGCKIFVDKKYNYIKTMRVYETKNKVKTSTINQMKEKTLVDEIKEEIKEAECKVQHQEFDTIKTCVESNIPVYLYGPAGSGKNFTLMEIAKELELDFYFTNSVQQEYKLTGFIDAGGIYHETEFYKAFKNGGLFFLDEMDASIPEVLVLLNAAIANGYFEFPNGRIEANENFRVVAAGNTIGNGADEMYTGRLVLDSATLDRFASIEFDYDRNVELNIAEGNEELVDFVEQLRERAKTYGVRATFSYRCISAIVKLEGKLELSKIITIAVLKGLDCDTINCLKDDNSDNKYFKAM